MKIVLAAAFIAAATPAVAGPFTVTNVQTDHDQIITLDSPLFSPMQSYVGRIDLTTSTGKTLHAWCIDLFHDVYVGGNQHLAYTTGPIVDDHHGAKLTIMQRQEISGLIHREDALFALGKATSTDSAATQLAIWSIEAQVTPPLRRCCCCAARHRCGRLGGGNRITTPTLGSMLTNVGNSYNRYDFDTAYQGLKHRFSHLKPQRHEICTGYITGTKSKGNVAYEDASYRLAPRPCLPAMAGPSTTIDFTGVANGTAVTNQYAGAVFSLQGGPDASGLPLTGTFGDAGLSNSASGSYPTASILDVKFTGGADGVSFVFNNEGWSGGGGRGTSFYQAFDKHGLQLATGSIDGGASNTDFTVSVGNIAELQFNNNIGGGDSWLFNLNKLTFTLVPEPMTVTLFGVGLLGLGLARRRAA